MAFCSKCGKEINNDAVICIHCGCAVNDVKPSNVTNTAYSGITGFSILGFFIPIVGLILYLMWNTTEPEKAKAVGKGAVIGFVASIVVSVLYTVIATVALGSLF